MNEIIAEYIKEQISVEAWITKLAGMTRVVNKIIVTGSEEDQSRSIRKSFPVAFTEEADCDDEGYLRELLPNSKESAVGYFEDRGTSPQGRERGKLLFKSNIRFVCWMNMDKIDTEAKTLSGLAAARIMKAIPTGAVNYDILQQIQVLSITEAVKSPEIFYPKYSMDPASVSYLVYPFDYFALDIESRFAVEVNCLPEIEVGDKCDTV